MAFDLSLYETVAQRLERWWATYETGRIITTIHHYDGSTIIMRAEGYNNDDRLIMIATHQYFPSIEPL